MSNTTAGGTAGCISMPLGSYQEIEFIIVKAIIV